MMLTHLRRPIVVFRCVPCFWLRPDVLRGDTEPQVIRSCCSGGAADEIAVIH